MTRDSMLDQVERGLAGDEGARRALRALLQAMENRLASLEAQQAVLDPDYGELRILEDGTPRATENGAARVIEPG